jgi:hypothetical protein
MHSVREGKRVGGGDPNLPGASGLGRKRGGK